MQLGGAEGLQRARQWVKVCSWLLGMHRRHGTPAAAHDRFAERENASDTLNGVNAIRFEVRDTGTGIPQNALKLIFEPVEPRKIGPFVLQGLFLKRQE